MKHVIQLNNLVTFKLNKHKTALSDCSDKIEIGISSHSFVNVGEFLYLSEEFVGRNGG